MQAEHKHVGQVLPLNQHLGSAVPTSQSESAVPAAHTVGADAALGTLAQYQVEVQRLRNEVQKLTQQLAKKDELLVAADLRIRKLQQFEPKNRGGRRSSSKKLYDPAGVDRECANQSPTQLQQLSPQMPLSPLPLQQQQQQQAHAQPQVQLQPSQQQQVPPPPPPVPPPPPQVGAPGRQEPARAAPALVAMVDKEQEGPKRKRSEADGSLRPGFCHHNRQRSRCIECGGSGICEHNKVRRNCKDCGGNNLCIPHKRPKSRCIDCGGASICEHKKLRRHCVDCGGVDVCVHKRIRRDCKECKGRGICEHNKHRSACKECKCKHDVPRGKCDKCGPGSRRSAATVAPGNGSTSSSWVLGQQASSAQSPLMVVNAHPAPGAQQHHGSAHASAPQATVNPEPTHSQMQMPVAMSAPG